MSIVSFHFFVFVGLFLIVYYGISEKYQWLCLLVMSVDFYLVNARKQAIWLLLTIAATYLFTNAIERFKEKGANTYFIRSLFIANTMFALLPLILLKYVLGGILESLTLPLGISFYTLQLIGYSCDVYSGRSRAEKNFLKYALFAMFFPHIIQGPIARYGQLSKSLYQRHPFEERNITSGFMLALWGLFLKLVLADQAAVIVNTVYGDYKTYSGAYILIAGVLYSIQLYADFMGCVCIAKGVASMFGVTLTDNFHHPYFAVSIKDFWRRWHISLSSWLKDYVYIPLGGNRKGRARTYFNLMATFAVSGFWHGAGLQFLFWGMLHGAYQIVGGVTQDVRARCKRALRIEGTVLDTILKRAITFVLVMLAWIFFRADSLKQGLKMLFFMVRDLRHGLSGQVLCELGLKPKEMAVLGMAILLLACVSALQERIKIREYVLKCPIVVRYIIYLAAMCAILIFGRYGSGYDAGQFIYGGF